MKALLKNRIRYSDIKLAKGIVLNKNSVVKRKGDTGLSTSTFGKYWFVLPQGKALFKTYDGLFCDDIRTNRIVNEIICEELCKQVGISCPSLSPASLDDYTGIVSFNVLKDNQQLITGTQLQKIAKTYMYNNILEDYAFLFDELKEIGFSVNKTKMLHDMYKICIFDLLTLQTDRHSDNIMFIKDEKTKKITVAPLIDNEFAFAGKKLTKIINNENISVENYLLNLYNSGNRCEIIKEMQQDHATLDKIVKRFVLLAKYDKNYDKILKQTLLSFDIKSALQNAEKKGYEISKEYCEFVESCSNYVKTMFINQYKKMKNINKQQLGEDFEMLY